MIRNSRIEIKTREETESGRNLEHLNLLNSLLSILGLRLYINNHVIAEPVYAVQTVDSEVDVQMQSSCGSTIIGYCVLDTLENDLGRNIQSFRTMDGRQIKNPYLGCRCMEEMLITRDLMEV